VGRRTKRYFIEREGSWGRLGRGLECEGGCCVTSIVASCRVMSHHCGVGWLTELFREILLSTKGLPRLGDEHTEVSPEADVTARGVSVTYEPVYSFFVYDHDKGAAVLYPRMATRRAIANMRGKVNEDTAMVVDAALLDVEGFFKG